MFEGFYIHIKLNNLEIKIRIKVKEKKRKRFDSLIMLSKFYKLNIIIKIQKKKTESEDAKKEIFFFSFLIVNAIL